MKTDKKKVILFVSNDLVCDNRVHKMALTLMKADFNVLVVGRKLPKSLPLHDVPYETERLRFIFTKGALFYAEMNLRYFLFLLFRSFDIATANDLDTLLGVYCATWIRRKQIVYDSHEYFTEVPELAHRPFVKRIWTAIERCLFPRLKNCITVCESIANIYAKTYGVPVRVVRNLPFLQEQYIETQRNNKLILYQGSLNVGRGLEMLISTMEFLPDAKLLIVGDGDIRVELQNLVRQKKLDDRVEFVGRVPYSEVENYTQMAAIGVSLEDDCCANYRFALPNKLFDYIQARKPVLVSDLPEMAQIVRQYCCGEVLQKRTAQDLAEQIRELLANPEKLREYIANCETAAHELCWEREEQQVLNVYSHLL
ncbi:MAG: glycosyltransferase [Bacteroidales bacterium]|nr:glycosyltransferase [Bacteroidales bacterium]